MNLVQSKPASAPIASSFEKHLEGRVYERARLKGRSVTFVPGWPVLSPADFLRAKSKGSLPFPLNAPSQSYFYVARSAIYHLFRALNFKADECVLVPNYHSGNEVAAIRATGTPIVYYSIDRNLQPDLDQLALLARGGARALYVIHFVGWPQPMSKIVEFCQTRGLILVEDCALSLLSQAVGQPLGSFGDYSIYCLYKTLPVPNGGLLVQNNASLPRIEPLQLHRCGRLSVTARSGDLILGWIRNRSNRFGKPLARLKKTIGRRLSAAGVTRVPVGDIGFNLSHVDLSMSPICRSLLDRFDYESILRIRRSNYQRMYERLVGKADSLCGELDDGVCPLFFPILVPNKPAAAQALSRLGIEATELWNYGDPQVPDDISADAEFLRRHVLELPIHQGVSEVQVDYMAEQVLRLGLYFRDDRRPAQETRFLSRSAPGESKSC
jgi:dTDP-4-amino-4,6-dideoxygalactose transaminase